MCPCRLPGGGSLLLPDQLLLGQAGPGQPEMHCVWKRTAPNGETSFQAWVGAQGERWVRAMGQASTHKTWTGASAIGPSGLLCFLLGGGLALDSPTQEGTLGRGSVK